MTPVELKLSNFLSYGEDAPPLDFSAFDVACISGANGQGKSSLLDAVTWALWGEARKTTEARKPDEHLLRQGARRMTVEFTFDHLGERYRVKRGYTTTASKKTPKPELEVVVLDAGGTARVLTAGSVKETQEHLDRILRVDYDTFVNASFLVQGRADEFARKKPRERKETLLRLLGLGRYERLEGRAAEKAAAARKALEAVEHEMRFVDEQIGLPDALAAERAAALDALDAARVAEAAAVSDADAVQAERAPLDAEKALLDDARRRLHDLDTERSSVAARRGELEQALNDATALLADAERIEAGRAALDAARQALDAARALQAEAIRLDAAVADLNRDLDRRRDAHAAALHRLDVELEAARVRLADLDARLATRADVQARADDAARALAAFRALDGVRTKRDEAERERAVARDALAREHDALRRRLEDLDTQRAAALRDADGREQTERALATARAAQARAVELADETTRLVADGKEAKAAEDLAAEALERARVAVQDGRERLETARVVPVDQPCPTCGTPLTEAHRQSVVADAEQALARLVETEHVRAAAHAKASERTEALRATVRRLREEQQRVTADAEQVVRLEARLAAVRDAQARADALAADHAAVQDVLERKAFRPDLREAYERWGTVLAELSFDAAEYDRVRRLSADADRHAATLRALDQDAAAADGLRDTLVARAADRDALDAQAASGEILGDLPARRDKALAERASVPFDAALLDAARERVEALAGAAARFDALRAAEREHSARLAENVRLADALAALDREADALGRRLADAAVLDERLAGLALRLAAARDAAATARRAADAHAKHLGALDQRLKKIEEHRERLAALADRAAAARETYALYRHLKTAFSRDGIPSLILEDTLPDLEARANDLLARLTDGRLSLRLDTLEDKKTGGTKETLNLNVSDETGASRPFETYSGGEAFRISFALRIALSQLLAERTDVAVRLLVVDEGFGTQDAEGVQHLVEALNLVKDDFDKVLVITHLDVLKNAFPTRIEVRKDPVRGSTFEVVQSG
ncbi:MAG: SMC family ATPase [Rhodothermales bacterium]|nr:SMC family ATPase [Rhodothermales bacterium]